ncbi:mediator of RNA polymerase II transcription subunit 29 isoform X2 [Meriones unguiculatus]|uniref:mediator of RNA polymerase II transcription subunit 29 isoform X2 n=1 Tax=Meriones unguiculatus TaxID=10047 RepID=UPI00293EFF8A|nr:mediator of RNA polymerase II transcription subunit 29 isoform X2 [Meriones unguiculatus]
MAAPQPQASAVSSAAGVSGPSSAGGPGPQQQPQSTQLVGPAQSGLLQQQQQDFDPVQRYKMLIPQLKESLQTLMKVAAQNLIQNTNIDNGQKSSDGPIQRFDKCLEEFYALCDQLELCLRLAHECLSQSCDSAKHSPTLVPTATKPDAVQPDSLPYPQYLAVIKAQITCAKDIHTALLDCANKVEARKLQVQSHPGTHSKTSSQPKGRGDPSTPKLRAQREAVQGLAPRRAVFEEEKAAEPARVAPACNLST